MITCLIVVTHELVHHESNRDHNTDEPWVNDREIFWRKFLNGRNKGDEENKQSRLRKKKYDGKPSSSPDPGAEGRTHSLLALLIVV